MDPYFTAISTTSTPTSLTFTRPADKPAMTATGRHIGRVSLHIQRDNLVQPQSCEFSPWSAAQVLRGGRNPVNDIVLTGDAHVRPLHFELVLVGERLLLRDPHDLGTPLSDNLSDNLSDSSDGIWFGHTQVREVWLNPGDSFRVGNSRVEIRALEFTKTPTPGVTQFGELHSQSPTMHGVFATLMQLAASDHKALLIHGEPGTGRKAVAQALHAASARCAGPFIVFDCAGVSTTHLARQLFHRGCCLDTAHGGTLLLKNIDQLSVQLQEQLLTTVTQGVLHYEDEPRHRRLNVRLVCSSARDLPRLVIQGRFSPALFEYLSATQVDLPPLRARGDDVSFLATQVFVKRLCTVTNRSRSLSPEALQALREHAWTRNIAELRRTVESGFFAANNEWIEPQDLPLHLTLSDELVRQLVELKGLFKSDHAAAVAGFERLYFDYLLKNHPSKAKATRTAKMTPEGFRLALKRLQLR